MSVKDLFKLDGRVTLIAGGSRGLGLQMAEALGEMGCRLAITARKADELEEARQRLAVQGLEVQTLPGDLQQTGEIPGVLEQVLARHGMIPRRQGKIINIASVAGLKGPAAGVHTIAYNTSKAALINFTRTLAAEWGRYNINVNALCPGLLSSKLSVGLLKQVQDAVIARAPLHRIGSEEDLKGAVVFLASEASRHITGQHLAVDGGSSIV